MSEAEVSCHFLICSAEYFISNEIHLVLQILDLDWSLGLAKLKCIERVDLTLHGFADLNVIPNGYKADNSCGTSLFLLTNPGQLHFYEYDSLSILKSKKGKNHSAHEMQYHSVIPTVEPYMTVGKLYMMSSERNIFSSHSKVLDIISHDFQVLSFHFFFQFNDQ